MKKMTLLLATASFAVIGMQSCKKEENDHKSPISETINVQLKANEAYTFTLPKNKRDDEYEITTHPSHSIISEVGRDASGSRIYQYTPSLNYVGTDQVVVANPQEGEQDHDGNGPKPKHHHLLPPPHGHHGGCDGGEEDHYIVTINFIVANDSTNK